MAQKPEDVSAAESTRKTGRHQHDHDRQLPLKPMFQKVWSVCVGEPEYDPHEHMQVAGAKVMSEGNLKYAHIKGWWSCAASSRRTWNRPRVKYDPTKFVYSARPG
ncbi:hypothetical protein PF002_g516 [Phytophthora fragariae]|uniref:Uncharacterized protein n=2 Tax=Phytophthora fragariae TaxID=53985 RepID=A0A6A3MHS7_9STRA|nr:hypothetical protein PF011_g322 [Phytophthora fragariae]KAE9257987.1 hypothetical protein PF002_g516 [Phytophthora fragariae]